MSISKKVISIVLLCLFGIAGFFVFYMGFAGRLMGWPLTQWTNNNPFWASKFVCYYLPFVMAALCWLLVEFLLRNEKHEGLFIGALYLTVSSLLSYYLFNGIVTFVYGIGDGRTINWVRFLAYLPLLGLSAFAIALPWLKRKMRLWLFFSICGALFLVYAGLVLAYDLMVLEMNPGLNNLFLAYLEALIAPLLTILVATVGFVLKFKARENKPNESEEALVQNR